MALKRLDLVVLRMPAARSYLLVLLKMRDVAGLQMIRREVPDFPSRAGLNRRLRHYLALERGPTRLEPRLRLKLSLGLRRRPDFDRAERVRYHASVQMFAPTSHVMVSPVATVNVEP